MTTLFSLKAIKLANAAAGLYYFEPATTRFFKSRCCSRVFVGESGTYFVTSERGPSGVRKYTVRLAKVNGECGTAPGATFQQFINRRTALRAAKVYAARK